MMRLISTALVSAGLLVLTACGGDTAAENNIVETTEVPADDLNAGLDNTLATDANLLDTNAVDANAADANAADANASTDTNTSNGY